MDPAPQQTRSTSVPVEGYADRIGLERALVDDVLSCSAIGPPAVVQAALRSFIDRTGADELMIASQIYDHAARLRSYESRHVLWRARISTLNAVTANACGIRRPQSCPCRGTPTLSASLFVAASFDAGGIAGTCSLSEPCGL